ncbi:extracellular solute-binding protein [Paenibacillus sp. GCM10027628]|uniref:extracellular solute-binding protein n=1 Tax=Paenibacillus sp. GCM10027628 TaxID=3273413 RepID=UPI00363D07CB
MAGKPKRTTFRTRLEDMVATLRKDILTGKLQPGDYLPSESMLTEQFQLSKNSVRKGLQVLLDQEMIEKAPRIGTRVIGPGLTNKLTLKFGYYPTLSLEANLLQLVEKFQQNHPHIAVQMIPLSNSYFSQNMKEALERDALDLITFNTQNYETVAETEAVWDFLEPLDRKDSTYSFLLDPFTKGGRLYVQPFIFSPIVLGYNRDHFKEAALPEPDSSWKWSDVQKAALTLTQKHDRIGILFHLQSINRWPLFMLQNKVVFNRDAGGKLILDNDQFREAMRISLGLFEGMNPETAYMSENDSDAERFFLQQKASMIVTSYYSLNHLRNAEFDYDISPLPYSLEAKTQLLIIGLALIKSSKHKEAAQALLEFLLSNEAQLHICKTTFSIPSVKTAAEWIGEETLPRPSRFFMYRDIIPTFSFYKDMNVTFRELETMRHMLKLYWARLDDFETVCRQLKATL